jgi:hypothetical protein
MRVIKMRGINKLILSEQEMTNALQYYFKHQMCPYSDFRENAKVVGVKQINFKQPFTVIISDPESMAEAKNLIDPIKS